MTCGRCARGWRRENGNIACGAPVDEVSFTGGDGINAIWAERKYGKFARVVAGAIAFGMPVGPPPEGIDAENMDPNDGTGCKMFEPSPGL